MARRRSSPYSTILESSTPNPGRLSMGNHWAVVGGGPDDPVRASPRYAIVKIQSRAATSEMV
ncbi:hypothetical protein D3C83_126620 [compost metagenome]